MARTNTTMSAWHRKSERTPPEQPERGAILPLLGGLLMVILLAGALAVDLSAIERRGQTLQNTADAAALAGVAKWVETGDSVATRLIIEDVIEQNGLDLGADIALQVDYISAVRVEVALVDTEPEVFLAGMIGQGSDIERAAAAELDRCNTDCNRTIEMPAPLGALELSGTGDGFVPVPVGSRLYAVNHHGPTIGCVDRLTRVPCWPSRSLFASPDANTANSLMTPVINDRLYYVGWDGVLNRTVLTCWDASIDTRCTDEADFGNHGHATLVETDGRLFAFTSSRQVFCVLPGTLQSCSGYATGKDTALTAEATWTPNDHAVYNSTFRIHNGRIYHTINNAGTGYMHCWNTRTDLPCTGFGVVSLDATAPSNSNGASGRLFFARNPAGGRTSICALGSAGVQCHDFTSGARLTAEETQFQDLVASFSGYEFSGWPGINTYHARSNRLFAVNAIQSRAYCHNFTTQSFCGTEQHTTTLGSPETYGFIGEGDCLIGLGDEAIFFAVQPDLTTECTGSFLSEQLSPCSCSGQLAWPPAEAVGTGLLAMFEVRVLAPNGALLLPDDGRDWLDLLNEDLDLSSVSLAYPYVTIEANVEGLPTTDPWSMPAVPAIEFGYEGHPHLIG